MISTKTAPDHLLQLCEFMLTYLVLGVLQPQTVQSGCPCLVIWSV